MAENSNIYPTLFNIGDIVSMNITGEKGWIIAKYDLDGNDIKLDVKLELDNRIVRSISSKDITVINYRDVSNDDEQPQTRSQTIADDISIQTTTDNESTDISNNSQPLKMLYDAIMDCFSWSRYNERNKLYIINLYWYLSLQMIVTSSS